MTLCRPTYTQQPLGRLAPHGVKPAKTIRFHVVMGVEEGRIALRFQQEKADGQDPTEQEYIAIDEDAIVEIHLHGDQVYFSKQLDAITTKEELGGFYGALEYDGYDEKLDRYRVARFVAKFNKGGKYDTNHPFNLNIDFLQRYCGDKPSWVALTIDPDIKNPPPMRT